MSEKITPTRPRRARVVVVAVAVAIVVMAVAAAYAITHIRGQAEKANAATKVNCVQTLKLRNALLRNVDLFESAVVDGWARREPDELATAEEKRIARTFFAGQRASLNAVNCP